MELHYLGEDVTRLTDNELEILNILLILLAYSDAEAEIFISKSVDKIIGHITVSKDEFRNDIIQNLLYINKTLKIKIEYSKSLAISQKISFSINL